MGCQHCKLFGFLFLLVQVFSAAFLSQTTTAFVPKRSICKRTHRPVDFVRGGSISDDNSFGRNGNDTGEERQDAYGRTIRNSNNAGEKDSGVSAGENDPMATYGNRAHNLDPLVVCGPSGVGKGTVIESLRKRFPSDVFGFSVSHTTRQPRPGEVHGQHYYFTTPGAIQEDIEKGLFVEHARVHGNYYGTSKKAIEVLQKENKITILDIDMQGVISVKESGIPARYVFVAPPSMRELEDRLRGRGTETEEAIRRRLGNAANEIEYGNTEGNFDRVFVNRDVEETVDEMVDVLREWFPQLKRAERSPVNSSEATDEQATKQPEGEESTDAYPSENNGQKTHTLPQSQPKALGNKMFCPSLREDSRSGPTDVREARFESNGSFSISGDSHPDLGKPNPTVNLMSDRAFEDKIAH